MALSATALTGAFRALDVEQIVADMVRLDPPQHRELDIDDVLVARQHQAFFRQIARPRAAAPGKILGARPISVLLTRSAGGVSTVSIG